MSLGLRFILGTISFQAAQVLDFLRNGCLRGGELSPDLPNPPPIILPYFGILRISDKNFNTRPTPEDTFPQPQTPMLGPSAVALHPPPPVTTVPQVQDDFYALNMENEISMDQPFGGGAPLNWAFNFAMDPAENNQLGEVGGIPMDIDAWSTVLEPI